MLLTLWLACHSDAPPPPIFDPAPRLSTVEEPEAPAFTNRLAAASSPYLRMHAHDPVDWHPWGEEAFAEAARRDVPIFLSIGYFACHWCHVMHRESFSDPDVAAFLNENFVPVKVDREERPDVDDVYMDALQRLNGRGGWPASLWLTPEGLPFYAGTYFPPEESRGRPGFLDVLTTLSGRWATERADAEALGRKLQVDLERGAAQRTGNLPDASLAAISARSLVAAWSPVTRGWGQRTQFPLHPRLQFLAGWAAAQPAGDTDRAAALAVLVGMLDVMDESGLNDHLGGGFHRYTVDPGWSIPHFEKMLYDNAQLVDIYAQGAVLTGRARYRQVVADTVGWMERELMHPSGAFYSSQGADSEDGEEGVFYVWTRDEVTSILSSPEDFLAVYPMRPEGNFEGKTVLRRAPGADPADAALGRAQLRRLRARRPAPPTDTKRVTAWNGLAVRGLARAGRLLGEPAYTDLAAGAAEAVLADFSAERGLPRVLGDAASPPGVLADYAMVADGLLALYAATGEPRWLVAADAVAGQMIARFTDPESGGLVLSTADDLFVQRRDVRDDSEPSAPGTAATVLLKLSAYGAPSGDRAVAEAVLRDADRTARRDPGSSPTIAMAAALADRQTMELVVSADDLADPRAATMLAAIDARLRPAAVSAALTPARLEALGGFAGLAGKSPGDAGVRGFVCFDGVCKQPTDDPAVFTALMDTATP